MESIKSPFIRRCRRAHARRRASLAPQVDDKVTRLLPDHDERGTPEVPFGKRSTRHREGVAPDSAAGNARLSARPGHRLNSERPQADSELA